MKQLPSAAIFLLLFLLSPYVIVQMCPDTVTQQGRFIEAGNGKGKRESAWVTDSVAGGLFRFGAPLAGSHFLFRASAFFNKFYFSPIAFVIYKAAGWSAYKYL